MKCPRCGREMEAGFLQSGEVISWVSKLYPFGLAYWKMDTEIVSDERKLNYNTVPTYICKDCKVLFGDYNQRNI